MAQNAFTLNYIFKQISFPSIVLELLKYHVPLLKYPWKIGHYDVGMAVSGRLWAYKDFLTVMVPKSFPNGLKKRCLENETVMFIYGDVFLRD